MLLNDKYIAYFSLYSSIDPNNVQLFLHAHPQYFNYVIHLLQLGAGVFEGSHPSIEERYEILPGSIIRLSGRDVPFGLTFVIPHLTCEEDFSELRKQVVAAKLNLPSTPWQPLLPPSPPHQAYTYADHTAEAIKAAKTNNELVLNILLGDKVTSAELAQLTEARREYGLQAATLYRNQLLLQTAPKLLLLLDQHRSRQLTETSNTIFTHAFNLCMLNNAEMFVNVKMSNLQTRPLLADLNDNEVSYEQWLRNLVHSTLAEHFGLPDDFNLANPRIVETLRMRLNIQNVHKIGDLPYIERIRQLLTSIEEKRKEHRDSIQMLLSGPIRFIPASYRYNNLRERAIVLEALLQVRVSPNAMDSDGNTLMHHALKKGSYQAVNLLLRNGASLIVQNNAAEDALQYASISREAFNQLMQTATNQLDGAQIPFLRQFSREMAIYEQGVLIPKENALNGGNGLGAIIRRMVCSQQTVDNRRKAIQALTELLHMASQNFNLQEFIIRVEAILQDLKSRKSEKLYKPLAKLVQEYHAHPEKYELVKRDATTVLQATISQLSRVVAQKNQEIEALRKDLEEKNNQQLTENEAGVRARAEERDRMAVQITERDTQLAERNTQIADRNTQIADRDTQIADRDAQLAAKNAEIAAQNARIERIEQELVENKKVWQEQQLMMQQLLGALRSQTNIASGGQQNVASLFSSSSPTFFSNTAAAAAASSAPAMPMPVCGGSQ